MNSCMAPGPAPVHLCALGARLPTAPVLIRRPDAELALGTSCPASGARTGSLTSRSNPGHSQKAKGTRVANAHPSLQKPTPPPPAARCPPLSAHPAGSRPNITPSGS